MYKKKYVFIYVPISLITICTAYSRLLFFILIIILLYYFFSTSKKTLLILFIVSLSFCIDWSELIGLVALRFDSGYVSRSDLIRGVQNKALFTEWLKYLWFGGGIGFYTTECIRSKSLPYLYESQLLSFLMKFGLIGFFILFFYWFSLIHKAFSKINRLHILFFIFMYVVYIASGMTNPYLISKVSGVIYLLFYSYLTEITKNQKRLCS